MLPPFACAGLRATRLYATYVGRGQHCATRKTIVPTRNLIPIIMLLPLACAGRGIIRATRDVAICSWTRPTLCHQNSGDARHTLLPHYHFHNRCLQSLPQSVMCLRRTRPCSFVPPEYMHICYICWTRPTSSCHAKKVAPTRNLLPYHHAVTTCSGWYRTRPYSCRPNKCIQDQHRATRITVVLLLICCCLLVSNEANIVLPENRYRPLIASCGFSDCCCRLCFQQRLRPLYKLSDDVWISRMEDR